MKNTPSSNDNKRYVEDNFLGAREGISDKGESLWAVYWRRFKKHTLGKVGAIILIVLYGLAILADFVSPFDMTWTDKTKSYHPPTSIRWIYEDQGKRVFRPFVYERWNVNVALKKYGLVPLYTLRAISIETAPGRAGLRSVIIDKNPISQKATLIDEVSKYYSLPTNHESMRRLANEIDAIRRDNTSDVTYRVSIGTKMVQGKETPQELLLVKGNKNFVKFFNEGVPYSFLGMFSSRIHLFGSPSGGYFPLGADKLGRDMLSRLLHGSRLSLTVGLLGAIITFTIGLLFGGIAGYFGGLTDSLMMRFSEVVMSFPAIYLLFALRSVFPPSLNSIQVYMLIVVIISFIGWARLGRIIRGMVLSLKNEDYVLSAKTMGLSDFKIVVKHILPNTLSFVIIQVTIAIPGYILGESALSLLGLGITEPQSSWGLMLAVARNFRVVSDFPWVLFPGFMIFIAIMAWNFFGDGIRDAVDPRSRH
ncbi:MAG: ABC transporter permease [Spirochaetales bacterium]|jgi:peptide/nickel transport system permease protein|nr:ABC transporter permease [Spirochaetales bacterium]